ncbi:hypothetical protein RND71_021554 [Anisodus tanguticus]|uniref:Uncharacterized protein n=1 Tax=Anisodus tanguticus TaxID=243964 RepID=A0AAE1RX66_9SOLA|nr:hypothetical protein RND71_021554 [Anisodus tanguticus]
MAFEITEIIEEEDVDSFWKMEKEAQRYNIRKIIKYQKSLFSSSTTTTTSLSSSSTSLSSYSSTPASSSSSSSSKKSNLLNLMKEGSTSLRKLFDMEHISLSSHFQDYSGSSIIKPHLLWSSDSDHYEINDDSWNFIQNHHQQKDESTSDDKKGVTLKESFSKQDFVIVDTKKRQRFNFGRHKLKRTKSFRKLPRFRFNLSRWGGFRVRRLKFSFCDRVKC